MLDMDITLQGGIYMFVAFLMIVLCDAQRNNPCTTYRYDSCIECMGADPKCSWCYDDNFPDDERCNTAGNLFNRGCSDYPSEISCRKSISHPVCSNKGRCVCGRCECSDAGVTGRYCQCDNFACPRYDGKLCGGPTHGSCHCGKCKCNDKYTFNDCSCPLSTHSCLAKNGHICNSKGNCVCGVCSCLDPNFWGPTCEECNMCSEGQCDRYKMCAECSLGIGGHKQTQCENNCGNNPVTHLYKIDQQDIGNSEQLCQFKNEDGCLIVFSYTWDMYGIRLSIQTHGECPEGWRDLRSSARHNNKHIGLFLSLTIVLVFIFFVS